jgi:serine/threonine protein kinase
MLNTRMPITEGNCDAEDASYKYIMRNKHEKFWENRRDISKRYKVDFNVSKDLKDLIDNMICTDPSIRLSLANIIAHPWMKGKTDSQK